MKSLVKTLMVTGTPGEMGVIVPDPNPRHQDTVSFEKWVDEEDDTPVTLDSPCCWYSAWTTVLISRGY